MTMLDQTTPVRPGTCPAWCAIDHTDPRELPVHPSDYVPHVARIGAVQDQELILQALTSSDGDGVAPHLLLLDHEHAWTLEQAEAMVTLWQDGVDALRRALALPVQAVSADDGLRVEIRTPHGPVQLDAQAAKATAERLLAAVELIDD